MFRFAFLCASILFLGSAIYQGSQTLSFIRSSYPTIGTVVENSYYRGPPRSPASESIVVKFKTSSGVEETAAVGAPFLKQYSRGAMIPLLVQDGNPVKVRLPFLPELWKWPSVFAVFGIGFMCVFLATRRRSPVSPET